MNLSFCSILSLHLIKKYIFCYKYEKFYIFIILFIQSYGPKSERTATRATRDPHGLDPDGLAGGPGL